MFDSDVLWSVEVGIFFYFLFFIIGFKGRVYLYQSNTWMGLHYIKLYVAYTVNLGNV